MIPLESILTLFPILTRQDKHRISKIRWCSYPRHRDIQRLIDKNGPPPLEHVPTVPSPIR